MKKSISLAAAAGCALALAATAAAAVAPQLQVISNSDGATTISYAQGTSDDPASKLQFFVPADYLATFAQQPGEPIGDARATASAGDAGGASVTLTGTTVVQAGTFVLASGQTLAAAGTACTGSPAHQSFWLVTLTGGGQTLQLPVFVDYALSGAFSTFASSTLTACPPAPDTPAGTAGRAPGGLKLTQFTLATQDVFSVAPGWYEWHVLTTPETPKAGTPNAAGAAEAQAIDRVPAELTVKVKRAKKSVTLSGRLTAGGKGLGGQSVTITAGGKAVAKAKTNGSGGYSVKVKTAKGKVVATAKVAAKSLPCSSAFFPPAPCTGSSYAAFTVTSG
jgi:hypothetical protein